MATLSLNIDSWTDATVQQLVTDQIPESLTVEFKRDLPVATPSEKREVAKDISAMANSAGGWIVYGVDEQQGPNGIKVAAAMSPLTQPADAAHRIDDIIAGSVTPRPQFRVREIAATGGIFVVVRVTASTDDLHMVTDNRFYRRSEQGARPMTEPEVRQAYTLIAQRRAEAKRFVLEVADAETRAPPGQGFTVILIPHTMRDVVDAAAIKADDPAISHVHHEHRNALVPFEGGIQATVGDSYRFRIRRDGTITFVFPGHSSDGWNPYQVAKHVLHVLAVARKLWPRSGIVEGATLAVRTNLPGPQKVAVDNWDLPNPKKLQPSQSFELGVPASDLYDAPLRTVRAVLDRLYQIMGERRCPLFRDDGQLEDRARQALREPLAAVTP